MLTVVYDPVNGQIVPDADAEDFAQRIIHGYKLGQYTIFYIGSELLLTALRLQVKRGNISPDDFQFSFKGQNLHVYDSGGILHWPKGFGDYTDNYLIEIL